MVRFVSSVIFFLIFIAGHRDGWSVREVYISIFFYDPLRMKVLFCNVRESVF